MTDLDWLDEVLDIYYMPEEIMTVRFFYDKKLGTGYGGRMKIVDWKAQIAKAITAHIEKEILKGRIDELKKIGIYVPPHSTQERYYDDRLADLNSQIGEK